MHASKCKAWVKTCTDVTILARMLPFEKRKKVAEAIEARIEVLQERP